MVNKHYIIFVKKVKNGGKIKYIFDLVKNQMTSVDTLQEVMLSEHYLYTGCVCQRLWLCQSVFKRIDCSSKYL